MPHGTVIVGAQRVAREALLDQGSRAATALDRLGVREGDAIALLIRNDSCYFEVLHAAALLGAYVVPLNWHSTADEIVYILSDCTPRALIGHADLIGRISRAVPADLPTLLIDSLIADDPSSTASPPLHAKSWPAFRDEAPGWMLSQMSSSSNSK